MNGSLVKAVTLLSAPLSKAARLIEALRQQREDQRREHPGSRGRGTHRRGTTAAAPTAEDRRFD